MARSQVGLFGQRWNIMSQNIRNIFENIEKKFGDVASWAIWKDYDGDNFTANMEVEGIFDLEKNPTVLNQINKDVIMVGLCFSVPLNPPPPKLHNFHIYNGYKVPYMTIKNASKIRYAFQNTPYYGAYMTDIVKNHTEPNSENVIFDKIENDFKIFRDEIKTLDTKAPTIIAFGGKVYNILKRNLRSNEYSRLVNVTHYAHYGNGCATHEGYKKRVLRQLAK